MKKCAFAFNVFSIFSHLISLCMLATHYQSDAV